MYGYERRELNKLIVCVKGRKFMLSQFQAYKEKKQEKASMQIILSIHEGKTGAVQEDYGVSQLSLLVTYLSMEVTSTNSLKKSRKMNMEFII